MKRLLPLLLAAACAPSAAVVTRAKTVHYDTDFPTVWNAVSAEMHERYEPAAIKVEDAPNGVIISDWKLVQVSQEATDGTSGEISGKGAAASVKQGTFMRTMVKIVGPRPFKIEVDAEAAEFRHNLSMLIPYKHGDVNEPGFVQGRINSLRVDLYKRLEKFAVVPRGTYVPEPAATTQPAPAPASAPAP